MTPFIHFQTRIPATAILASFENSCRAHIYQLPNPPRHIHPSFFKHPPVQALR